MLEEALAMLLRHSRVKVLHAADGSGLGAALAALVAQ